ncbi:MAG: LSU ribosomal protein L24P [Candidatus Kentron sp. G]|nr:MAG: LSU ribosomal protein L24P [Candidatus Kentron sp. G]VFM95498.1 MAG: LSU ribosomal protein L24P [Candidatus Kentron sp. G]VFM97145.1 MAG: LSU ribosomal protein L24P [Candidatus Kentron sp. G]
MRKIRKGDDVIVLAGKDRRKRGTVLQVFSDDRLLVEGINMAKKHVKPNLQKGVSGDLVNKEMPIHLSNVALYNLVAAKSGRVGFRFLEDGRKVRYFKSTGEVIDV